MTSTVSTGSKVPGIVSWILRVLLAAFFAFAAFAKLTGQPMMVAEFGQIGFGQWFRYVTAIVELIGIILLLTPRRSFWGAGLLLLVDISAFFVQLLILHGDIIHTIVVAVVLLVVLYLQRPSAAVVP